MKKTKTKRAVKKRDRQFDEWSSQSISDLCCVLGANPRQEKAYIKRLIKRISLERIAQRKNDRRRAKKVTMTVGELEDRIKAAEDKYKNTDY